MIKIYQNIIIGFNDLGSGVIKDTSRIFCSQGSTLPDEISVKVNIDTKAPDRIGFCPQGEKNEMRVRDMEFKGNPDGENEEKSENRRESAERFCVHFQSLKEALRMEWERVQTPALQRRLAENGFEIKGQKLFVAGDLSDGSTSASIIPLLGALKYLLENKDIPEIRWNVAGVFGTNDSPVGKIHTYAFLKELNYIHTSGNPVKISLKTPPINREIDLAGINFNLYLLDSRARGVSSISRENVTDIISRFIFWETFFEQNGVMPDQNRLFFHSFGIAQPVLPLKELHDGVAVKNVNTVCDAYSLLHGSEGEEKKEFADLAIKRMRESPNFEEIRFPGYRQFIWQDMEMKPQDFSRDYKMMAEVKKAFGDEKKKLEENFESAVETGKKLLENPFYLSLKKQLDLLLDSSFFGYAGACRIMDECRKQLKDSLEGLKSIPFDVPADSEILKTERDTENAVSADIPFPVIVMTFIFILIPFALGAMEFLLWKNPGEPVLLSRILIMAGVIITAFIGAWSQKKLMEGTIEEHFYKYVSIYQRLNRGRYHKTMKETLEKYYSQLIHLVEGSQEDSVSKLPREIGVTEPLALSLEKYMELMKNYKYASIKPPLRYYSSYALFKPTSEKDLQLFAKSFLPEVFNLEKTEPIRKSDGILQTAGAGLPSWQAVLRDPVQASVFYDTLKKNILEKLEKDSLERKTDIWSVIGTMDEDRFNPLFIQLQNISTPLICLKDNVILDEEKVLSREKMVYYSKGGDGVEIFKNYVSNAGFTAYRMDFPENLLILTQLFRSIHIYKLAYLDDWKYFEGRLDEESRKNLYFCNDVLTAPDINYQSICSGVSP